MKKILILAAVAAFVATVYACEYPDMELSGLKSAIEAKKVVLLDANGTESWQKGHIPGAIDFSANKDKLADLLPKEKDALIVAYCGGPNCNAYLSAAMAAEKLGYTNVKHFTAGISGWIKAGEKTEPGPTPTAGNSASNN